MHTMAAHNTSSTMRLKAAAFIQSYPFAVVFSNYIQPSPEVQSLNACARYSFDVSGHMKIFSMGKQIISPADRQKETVQVLQLERF
jgi:hypothetical protein